MTITDAFGGQARVLYSFTGPVTNGTTFAVVSPYWAGGTPTTQYGLRINDQGYAGVTTAYGLYVDAQTSATHHYAAVFAGGNVGIGTTAPQYLLAVNGTIGTKEVVVTSTGWADYVLRPDYRLRPLSEVKAYVQEHHSLPGMPSEAEVNAKGVGLGEMQVKLLAKIEELTLHLIQLEEKNQDLQRRLARIEVRERQ